MSSNYTTGPDGNPARPSSSLYRTEELPVTLGAATVRRVAHELAVDIIDTVRASPGPIVWLTGNSYMPPMRSFPAAEQVHQSDNNRTGELFWWFAELVDDHLARANVVMECPEYDNALYGVDLKRWQYKDHNGEHHPDFYETWDMNDDWEPVDPDAVDDNAENPRE